MSTPLIALTPSHDTDNNDIKMRPTYLRALRAAGAIPVILPLETSQEDLIQLSHSFDGFLFTGGPDIHPFLFHEETHIHCGDVSSQRDKMELALLPLAMALKKPILGICRGIQLLNIGLGGTLWQDIPSQIKSDFPIAHSQPFAYSLPAHTVSLAPESKLASITGNLSLQVNSMHHQAVKDVAPGLIVSAVSPDHLVEAVELPNYPFLIGVQWHPEHLYEQDSASTKLFSAFAAACNNSPIV